MRSIVYIFLIITFSLTAYEDAQYVHFESLLNSSFRQAIHDAGALPIYVDYSKMAFKETFQEFIHGNSLEEMSKALENWSTEFLSSEEAFAWEKSNYRFGIFGSNQSTHKKTRLIQGINCKMCIEYCDWIRENKRTELETIPYLERLLDRLTHLDHISHQVFLEKVTEIAKSHPEIQQIFYSYKGQPRLPITLRLIRFEKSEKFTLPLHYDISVMSLIFPSDDDPFNECLLVAPADGSPFTVEKLKRALRPFPKKENDSCALLISGTLLSYLNIPIDPTPHGVLPHERDFRCVIVACLHIPNLDTSAQSTLLPTLTEIPEHLKKKKNEP